MSQLALLYRLMIPGRTVRLAAGFCPHPETGAPPWAETLERIRNSGTTLGRRVLGDAVRHNSKEKA